MKRLYTIQYPGDLANSNYWRAGQLLATPIECWHLDSLTGKSEKVRVIRFRGSCDYFYAETGYADLDNGNTVSAFYLFTQKPKLVNIEDSFGKCKQWVAGPGKLLKKIFGD